MASVNKVILIGNLGKDPEARFFQSGQKYVSFPLVIAKTKQNGTTSRFIMRLLCVLPKPI